MAREPINGIGLNLMVMPKIHHDVRDFKHAFYFEIVELTK